MCISLGQGGDVAVNPFADAEDHGRHRKPEVKLFLTLESLCLLLPSPKVLVFSSQGWFSYYSVFNFTLPQGGPLFSPRPLSQHSVSIPYRVSIAVCFSCVYCLLSYFLSPPLEHVFHRSKDLVLFTIISSIPSSWYVGGVQ